MKGLLILLLISASYAYPVAKTWTFNELKHAIPWNKRTEFGRNRDQKALIDAFDEMMAAVYSGRENYVQAIMLSPSGSKVWTEEQLTQALSSNDTDPNLVSWLETAHVFLRRQNQKENGTKQDTIEVWVPTLDISTWTEDEVTTALKDPKVRPDLLPFLQSAQKELDEAKEKGEKLESAKLVTPVGVIPKPEGEPILFVARSVHDNMLANKEQIVTHYSKVKRL